MHNVVNRIKREREREKESLNISEYLFTGCTSIVFINNLHATETTNMCRLYNLHKVVYQAEIIRQAYLYLCCHKQDSIMHMYIPNIDTN